MVQVRINKYISDTGFCSRREADKLIEDTRVTVNGELAMPGTRVSEGDSVRIDGETLRANPVSFEVRPKTPKPARKRVVRTPADDEPARKSSHKGTRGGGRKNTDDDATFVLRRSASAPIKHTRSSHRKGNAPGNKSRY